MSSPIPVVMAGESGPASQVRTGTLTSSTATSVFVLVGGTQVEAAFLTWYTPRVGDLVALIRTDASWLCLGQYAGTGQNEIQNPSFELSGPGMPPSLWFLADLVGLSQVTVVASDNAPDGDHYAQVFSDAATSSSYLYSSPIAVESGDIFSVSAYAMGIYDIDQPQTADAALVALWFANSDDFYPTTSSADIVVTTFTDVPSGPPFVQLSGSVTAPVGGFMRLALRSNLSVGQAMAWDFATARRTG